MVPFHSLQESWCQPHSHLAAPTNVCVSPALSSGFSGWCQVVTVMESQPPCKTELLLLLGTWSPLAFPPTRWFWDIVRATCSPRGDTVHPHIHMKTTRGEAGCTSPA